MYERLIFPTRIEKDGTKQLILTNFPHARIWTVPDYNLSVYVEDMELDIEKEYFFEWAVQTYPVLFFCFYLSMELMENPPWIQNVLTKLKYAKGFLLES